MNMSRSVKRLVFFVAFGVIVIMVSKSLLNRAVKNLSIEADKKQQAKASKQAILPESAPVPAVLPVPEVSNPLNPAGNNGVLVESSPVAIENSSAAR